MNNELVHSARSNVTSLLLSRTAHSSTAKVSTSGSRWIDAGTGRVWIRTRNSIFTRSEKYQKTSITEQATNSRLDRKNLFEDFRRCAAIKKNLTLNNLKSSLKIYFRILFIAEGSGAMMYERDEKKLKRKVENDFFNTRRISQLSTTGFFFSSTFFLYFSLFSSTWAASDVRQEKKPSQTTTAIVSSSMKSMSKWHAMHRWMSNCRDRKRRRRKKKKTWRNFFFRNCENDKCRAIEAAPATIPKTWIGRNRLQQNKKDAICNCVDPIAKSSFGSFTQEHDDISWVENAEVQG